MSTLRSFRSVIPLALALALAPQARAATAVNADSARKPKTLSDQFEGLKFRCIGPWRGGRVTAVTGVRGQPLAFYFGATGGGVWKTSDGGSNWENVSDKYFATGSVGAIAVSESDPNVVYAGMGESPIRGNLSAGDGVYRSTDAGLTWTHVGLEKSGQIARLRIDPHNPDLAYAAVQGHAWGPNPERGVYRTGDGGRNWKRVLFVNDSTGACDLAMDPDNPRVLYAAMWQVVRRPWELVSGGPGSGLWRSLDGGDTWKKLDEGLPEGMLGRIGVSCSGARPGLVYAIIEAKKGGLYRSNDRGDSWTWVNDDHDIRQRPWYYTWVTADPKNADRVYLPNLRLYRSNDGGKTFAGIQAIWDHHDLWIDPDDPQRMILGADGGCAVSYNAGRTWSSIRNQPTAQFYRVTTDDRFPYWVYGAQQDNSSVAVPSASANAGIGESDWHEIGGGESGWIAPDPRDPDRLYGGGYGGSITRYDHRLREYREVMVWPQLASGRPTRELKYRFQWNAPILVSRWDSTTVYHAAQVLLRSRDEGETWEEVSPDLTRNDRAKQGLSGGPITRDVTGVEVYCTIFALAESPVERGVMWAGSDDGLIHVTRDGCAHWSNVTPRGIPEWIQINAIDASPHDAGSAYVAATRYKFDDARPYLYRTRDYGRTWTRIDKGIPDGAFTRVVREDPVRRGLLYAGTERGLYLSFDDGGSWIPFQRNLPHVPITDLVVKNGDLVVATQGRAFWILDDLTALRDWQPALATAPFHLFPPRPAYRSQLGFSGDEPPHNQGVNPPSGVPIDYWLARKPREREIVKLEILSGDSVIRSFTSDKPAKPEDLKTQSERAELEKERDKPLEPKAGLNRFVWDMRILRPTLVPKAVFNEGDKSPPRVGAGTYRVRMTAAGRTETATLEVRPRPGGYATPEDLAAQFKLLAAIRDRLSEAHLAVMTIRDVRSQVDDLAARAGRVGRGGDLAERAKKLDARLTAVELQLINPDIKGLEDDLNYPPRIDHDLTYLAGVVGSADRRPTAGAVRQYEELAAQLRRIQGELEQILDTDLAEFNGEVARMQVPPVAAAPKVER